MFRAAIRQWAGYSSCKGKKTIRNPTGVSRKSVVII